MIFTATTEDDLLPVVKHLHLLTQEQKVLTFTGNLGAGKTTLIKHFCNYLGVLNNVSSPTFGLVNEYQTEKGEIIYHFDCYRMNDITEAYDIGFEEYIDSGNICCIEWPEVIEPLLPQKYIAVIFNMLSGKERKIEVKELS